MKNEELKMKNCEAIAEAQARQLKTKNQELCDMN